MKNVWIVGLGGIGTAICDQFSQQDIAVKTFTRSGISPFDITDEGAISEYVRTCPQLPDAVVMSAGILYDSHHRPEKSISNFDAQWLSQNITVNVLPSIYFAKAIHARLQHRDQLKFACLIARVSSISDNRLGGWYSYRMSKCMLNMFVKNMAIEWHRMHPALLFLANTQVPSTRCCPSHFKVASRKPNASPQSGPHSISWNASTAERLSIVAISTIGSKSPSCLRLP